MTPFRRCSGILAALILCCVVLCVPVSAAEHSVAPSGAEFSSIKDAIDWSIGGDTIRVESGTYTDNLKLDKKLILIGIDTGGGAPVIAPSKTGNTVEILADGCTVQGFTIQNSATASGIQINSHSNTIRQNTIKNNAVGITLVSADKNTLLNNAISGNSRVGINLESASATQIDGNTVQDNAVGITLDADSRSNTVSRNLFDNTQNVISRSPSSLWSTASTFRYIYLGKPFQSRLGNHWSDYKGTDTDGNGIGDIPYLTNIDAGKSGASVTSYDNDAFPLMDPLAYYSGMSMGASPGSVSSPPTTTQNNLLPAKPAGSPGIIVPTKTSPVATQPPASAGMDYRNPQSYPPLAIALIVIGSVLAGIGLYLFRTRSESQASTPLPLPGVNQVASVLKTAVERTRALVTIPVFKTKAGSAEETVALSVPTATDQKNYFPRELESKYIDISFIGRGGIAWVFSATRKSDGRHVAVKIPISFDEVTGKCFLNEIAAWETLRHENIVEVCGVNILPVPYVEMEFVPTSLETVEKPMPVWKAVHLITGVAEGLRYAHEHGFIHRDIKPHNILLTGEFVPKITDWGMSKVLAADVKKSSVAGFSLSYAAPEQVSPSEFGRTDERTDIYQLGVVFYELVTGTVPFGGESIVEVGNAILREPPIPPSEYNPEAEAVEKIILTCLEKAPDHRFQSAAEFLEAVRGYLDEDDE